MHSKLIPYLKDRAVFAEFGNEVHAMRLELAAYELEVQGLMSKKDDAWKERHSKIIKDRRKRLELFDLVYEYLEASHSDSFLVRKKITTICNKLQGEILSGKTFPKELTDAQVQSMGDILGILVEIYKENVELKEKTNNELC